MCIVKCRFVSNFFISPALTQHLRLVNNAETLKPTVHSLNIASRRGPQPVCESVTPQRTHQCCNGTALGGRIYGVIRKRCRQAIPKQTDWLDRTHITIRHPKRPVCKPLLELQMLWTLAARHDLQNDSEQTISAVLMNFRLKYSWFGPSTCHGEPDFHRHG